MPEEKLDTSSLEALDFAPRCEYNENASKSEDRLEWPDCQTPAEWKIISTCCGVVLIGCTEHKDQFVEHVGAINGFLDHPPCGAVGDAGFRVEPLT